MITKEKVCLVSFGIDEETGKPMTNILKEIQWQGLSDDEIAKLNLDGYADEGELKFARAIEQALKEKNA